MSEAQALAAVLADPWPDAPRRAFAASTTPDRAEFTQLGLKLAKALRARDRYDSWSGVEMAMFIAGAKRASWAVGVTKVLGAVQMTWGRGFVEGVTCDAGVFVDRAADLYAVAPILDLRLTGVKAHAGDLFDSPFFARVRSLGFEDKIDDGVLSALAASQFAGKLRWLNLYGQPVTEKGIEALAKSTHLGKLGWVGGGAGAPEVNPELVEDEGGVYDSRPNPLAARLAAKFGKRAWLEGWTEREAPRPEAVE